MFKLFSSVMALVIFGAPCFGGEVDPLDDRNAADNAMLTWFDAGAPVGHMLLIRRGADSCVVRFTAFHRDHDAKPPNTFSSGEESFFAEYDWFYPKASAAESGRPDYDTGHRKVSRKPTAGVGRLAFQSGDDEVQCGSFRLAWFYPVRVGFNNRGAKRFCQFRLGQSVPPNQ
jgi:hypothetical protein